MRNDITYAIRDAEILKNAFGIFFLELLFYSYFIGQTKPFLGGIFFLFILLSLLLSRALSLIVLFSFTLASARFAYLYFEHSHESIEAYIFTAVALFFISMIHINTYFFYHEAEDIEDDAYDLEN
jgi:hypothetical protein